jgi:hypothetical protein
MKQRVSLRVGGPGEGVKINKRTFGERTRWRHCVRFRPGWGIDGWHWRGRVLQRIPHLSHDQVQVLVGRGSCLARTGRDAHLFHHL